MPEKDRRELREAQDRFILEWGRMSSSWGINRTMAQIHALLLVCDRSFSMDEIIERLHISRGNASMNLRDLQDWGLVERTRAAGDRKDLYQARGTISEMFIRVVKERKRREIDPTVAAIRDCLSRIPTDEDKEAEITRHRMTSLLEIFGLIDLVYDKVFTGDDAVSQAKTLLQE